VKERNKAVRKEEERRGVEGRGEEERGGEMEWYGSVSKL
jgi:hypothetical protein